MPDTVERTQRSFASGEISPLLYLRPDLARFATALATCSNFVVLPQGGATARSGSRYIETALATAERLIGFQFSDEVGYILEFSDNKMRVYKDSGIVLSGPSPFELTTTFNDVDLPTIDYTQSADVLYIVSGVHPEKQIQRLADDNWSEVESVNAGGPFRKMNLDETVILFTTTTEPADGYVVGTSITLKADGANVFTSNHVGALFRLEQQDKSVVREWESGHSYGIGEKVRVGPNVYKLVDKNGTNQSVTPPTHTEGDRWHGRDVGSTGNFKWRYLHSNFGIVEVTAFTSATEVTATVKSFLPSDIFATEGPLVGGTWRWNEGEWSAERGYPRAIAFHEQRKFAASTKSNPIGLWGSVTGDFENFAAGDAADEALSYIVASNRVNAIRSLVSGRRLALLTSGEEWAISGSDTREPITPTNVVILSGSDEGSKKVKAVKVGNPLFVSKDGRRLMELSYDFQNDNLLAGDLSIFADHLLKVGIKEQAWQREPYRVLWLLLGDGTLAGLTYRRDQDIIGWHRHTIEGGSVRSIAVKPSPDGAEDELWLLVDRTINSAAVRYVERLQPFFEAQSTHDITDAWFLESALQYSGAPVTTITGLGHLEGETVSALADGKVVAPQEVTGGQITLPVAASKVTVGLDFEGRIKSLPLHADTQTGSIDARQKRVAAVTVHLQNTALGQVQGPGEPPEPINPSSGLVMGDPPPLITGPRKVTIGSDWSREGQVDVIRDAPVPMTILAMTTNRQVSENV